ncbi:MAG: sce7726 family protein [Lachnospiraceae bacterium]|nr:sce7726 family protein [Lachnospiraceae bacterium]
MLDRDMREPLFDYLEDFYGKIRILEEKSVGSSRMDVFAVLDGEFIGFEIKSDSDSYTRLKTQTVDYDRVCDYCYLVVGRSHRQHAHEHIPPHWGMLVVQETDDGQVEVLMDQLPARNEKTTLAEQICFLWRPELQQLLKDNELPAYAAKSKQFVRDVLLERVDPVALKRQITDILFERDYQQLLEQIYQKRVENAAKRGKRIRSALPKRTKKKRRRRSS